MLTALIVFVATYVFLAGADFPFLKLDRPGGALAGAVAMVVLGVVTPAQVTGDAINWDTLLLLMAMMVIGSALARAGVFRWVSWQVLRRAGSARALLTALVFTSGTLSALLVNDTVCLMCTPLVVALIDDADLPPWPFLLALAFGANAGSVATPTGNPQNMLVATLSGLGWVRFTLALALPALLGLASVALVLQLWFRRELTARGAIAVHLPRPPLDRRSAWICVAVLALVVTGFVLGRPAPLNHAGAPHPLELGMAWTAMAGAALVLVLTPGPPREALAGVDWTLLLFFAALFVVTFGVAHAGVAERLYRAFEPWLGTTAVEQTLRFGAFTVVGSQLVSNVPFVLLAGTWLHRMADPEAAWLSLALVSTVAGNLTPVGSVANLIVLESAGEKGRIPFWRFVAVGAVCTAAPLAVGVGTLFAERALGLVGR